MTVVERAYLWVAIYSYLYHLRIRPNYSSIFFN